MGTRSGIALSAFAGGLLLTLAFACGEPIPEAAPDDGGPSRDSTTGPDGATSASGDPASCLPDGAFIIGPSDVDCPGGTTAKNVQTNPQARADACTCACNITSQGSCDGADLKWEWGENGCGESNETFTIAPGECQIHYPNNLVTLAPLNRWPVRGPSAGACTSSATPHVDKVTTSAIRECVPNAGACITAYAGDRVCVPAQPGTPCSGTHSVELVVGDGPDLACAPCTGCTVTNAACTVEYHGNTTCTDLKYEQITNGQCLSTMKPAIRAFKILAKGGKCNTTPGTPTPSVTNANTYCCTP